MEMNKFSELKELKVQLQKSNIKDKWNIIRKAYELVLPEISSVSEKRRKGKISPYFLDFCNEFTPIEDDSWMTIRCLGTPLYPQFPVQNYFLDFGNPFYKIGLEIDGKEYHQDVHKDTKRDENLNSFGWRTFRITGSESKRTRKHPYELFEEKKDNKEENEKQIEDWVLNTGEGIITAIHEIYFSTCPKNYFGDHHGFPSYQEMLDLYMKSLNQHRIINFELLDSTNPQDQSRLKDLFGCEQNEFE
jgi:very-short-patch-repair endonuclease